MSKIFTIEEIRQMTKNWINGTDDKSKRAWRKLLRDVKNKQKKIACIILKILLYLSHRNTNEI